MNSTEPFNHYTTQTKTSITLEATATQKDNAKKEMREKKREKISQRRSQRSSRASEEP